MRYSEAAREIDSANILDADKLKQRSEAADHMLDDFMSWWENQKSAETSYYSAFILSNMLFYDAVKCYEHGLFEAAMIMARDAIDSGLFFAVNYTPSFNDSKFYIGASPSGERGADGSMKDSWRYLKTRVIKFKLLSEYELSKIETLRDIGHFSAHLAARQDKQNIEYGKKILDGKQWEQIGKEFSREPFMSAEDTETRLKETAKYLTLIRECYFQHYSNPRK